MMNLNYPCKFYPTLGHLHSWAYDSTQPFYTVTVQKFANLYTDIQKLFNGTHENPYKPIYDEQGQVTGYEKLRATAINFDSLFNYDYDEYKIWYPARIGYKDPRIYPNGPYDYNDAMLRCLNEFERRINDWYNMNHWRYALMLGSLELQYDPISNYDMEEHGNTDEDFDKYVKNPERMMSKKITTPIDQITFTPVPDDEDPHTDVTIAANVEKTVSNASVVHPGDFTHNIASYETAAATKVEYKDTQLQTSTDVKQTAMAEIKTGSDENPYNTHTNGSHDLTRKGNIGVTTTQQMLEQELALRQKNIVQQAVDDIVRYVFLSVH